LPSSGYPKMPLKDVSVRNAKVGDKPYKLYDERGLFLLVNPNGSKWVALQEVGGASNTGSRVRKSSSL
jgi:hypothetical protein